MLNREQSEAVADALLTPSLEGQEADRLRLEKQRRERAARQRYAWLGLAGFAIGAAVGYTLLGNVIPAAFVGLALGFIAANILARRAA